MNIESPLVSPVSGGKQAHNLKSEWYKLTEKTNEGKKYVKEKGTNSKELYLKECQIFAGSICVKFNMLCSFPELSWKFSSTSCNTVGGAQLTNLNMYNTSFVTHSKLLN